MRLSVLALSGTAAVLCAAPLPAQPEPPVTDGKVIVPLTLHPAPAAKPASTTYLLPEYGESIPGNRVHMFLRCFMEQDSLFGREGADWREKWNKMPLSELPTGDLKDYAGRLARQDMYDAARMLQVDWQLWYFFRRDVFGTLLPDVQKMRALADVLKTRARGQIAARDFPGAIRTLKTLFGLARTFEPHPTMIGQLVGMAIAATGCGVVEELVQQPGCPNLFWSLTDLPSPFIPVRLGVQGERMVGGVEFQALVEATGPLPDMVLGKMIAHMEELAEVEFRTGAGQPKKSPRARFAAWAADPRRVEEARKRLVAAGFDPGLVRAMTPLQAVFTDDVRRYEVARDELFKWLNQPYWQATGARRVEEELRKAEGDLVVGPILIPAAMKVKSAEARTDQRIAFLRVIEAVRLHAHEHGGTLPASLAEVALPLPVDPVSGKPFTYTVQDGVATLTGENPNPGTEKTNRVYRITLRK